MTMESSCAHVRAYLHAAEEALREARVLLENGLLKGAVNRAYYAMFYAALAALVSEQQEKLPKRHRAVIAGFYHHFVEPAKVRREFHRDLVRAFRLRQQSDYEVHAHLGEDEVREVVEKAEAFVAQVKEMVALGHR